MALWPTTILVVDDNDIVRLATKQLLGIDRTIFVASSGREAIEIFEMHPTAIECVLLDIVMPGFSGIDTFLGLRKVRSDIPVLFMSGYCQENTVSDLMSAGPVSFIQKPFLYDELLAKLAHLAGLAQPLCQSISRPPERMNHP